MYTLFCNYGLGKVFLNNEKFHICVFRESVFIGTKSNRLVIGLNQNYVHFRTMKFEYGSVLFYILYNYVKRKDLNMLS